MTVLYNSNFNYQKLIHIITINSYTALCWARVSSKEWVSQITRNYKNTDKYIHTIQVSFCNRQNHCCLLIYPSSPARYGSVLYTYIYLRLAVNLLRARSMRLITFPKIPASSGSIIGYSGYFLLWPLFVHVKKVLFR